MKAITRHFVYTAAGRRVHYRKAGKGPPLVLLHASPCSSRVQIPLLRAWGDDFTVLAFDTPGFGLSEPLGKPGLDIGDLAEALAETLAALGLERVLLYGRHTGGSIAVEFARRHPDRAAFVLTDGYTVTPKMPSDAYLDAYLPPIVPRSDGSHLLWLWHRYRDQFIFWPWNDANGLRADVDLPSLDALQRGVIEFLEAGNAYRDVYAAALRYRWDDPLPDLATPVCFGVRAGDSQFHKADYLRAAGVDVTVMPRDPGEAALAELAILRRHGQEIGDAPGPAEPCGGELTYVDIGDGRQLFARSRGSGAGLPLVVLPPIPGGSGQLPDLMDALGSDRRVLAIDAPGNGYSDGLAGPAGIEGWADAVSTALDRIGIGRTSLYGRHGGAALAVELAARFPERFAGVVLDAPIVLGEAESVDAGASFCPPLEPRWDGSHLVSLWHFARDQRLWWPWHARKRLHIHPNRPPIDLDELHAETATLALNLDTVAASWRAVLSYPLAERMKAVRQPMMIGARADDVFAPCLALAQACRPDAVRGDFGPAQHATIRAFLRGQ